MLTRTVSYFQQHSIKKWILHILHALIWLTAAVVFSKTCKTDENNINLKHWRIVLMQQNHSNLYNNTVSYTTSSRIWDRAFLPNGFDNFQGFQSLSKLDKQMRITKQYIWLWSLSFNKSDSAYCIFLYVPLIQRLKDKITAHVPDSVQHKILNKLEDIPIFAIEKPRIFIMDIYNSSLRASAWCLLCRTGNV